MNLYRAPDFALAVTLLFIVWLGGLHFNQVKDIHKYHDKDKIQALYASDSPDDENGAAEYEYNRLKDPATGQIPVDMRKREIAFAAKLPSHDESRSTQWQSRGPYNLGGRTRALAIDATNENTIFAGQVTGGMWRSTDGGQSFTQSTQPEQLHSSTCITQDKRQGHTNVWYYGTGEQYAIVNAAGFSSQFSGDGIFKSTDGGVSWSQLSSTVSNTPTTLYQKRDFDFVWQMVTNPTNQSQDEVYAAVVNGVWRSIDGGTSWTSVLGLNNDSSGISSYTSIAITTTGVLYATISSETYAKGIWRSTDGVNWTNITPVGFPTNYERIEIGIAPEDENMVYFIAQAPGTGANGNALYRYKYLSGSGTGNGGQWIDRTNNIPHDHCIGYQNFDYLTYNTQGSYDMYIKVSPDDTDMVFLGGTDLYRSQFGFSLYQYDWIGGYSCDSTVSSFHTYPNHHPDQHNLVFFPSNPNKAISSNDGGIMETDDITADPVVWRSLNNGYVTGQFYTCAIEPGNTTSDIIMGGLQDNGTYFGSSINNKQTWPHVLFGDGSYCAVAHNRTNYYASWQSGKVYKMAISDSGVVNGFTCITPKGGGSNFSFVNPFILDPLDDNRMYMPAGKFIWRNDSLSAIPIVTNVYNPISQGWTILNGTQLGNVFPVPNISALDISEANTDRLYFGTDQGTVYRLDSCRTSTTHQRVNITGSNFPNGAYVSCVETDRLDANNVMVTFSNYNVISIFYSSDSGTTWQNVSGNLEDKPDGSGNGPSVTWAHIYNDGTTKKYYVGTSIGLFSTDTLQGLNTIWTQEGANTIGNEIVTMITSRTYDNNIVVATHGNGMYSNKVYNPSAVNDIKQNALKMTCYPNPFTSSTVIELSGAKGETTTEVFDINGKMVRRLRSTTGKLVWDGQDGDSRTCPTGIYLLRTSSNNITTTGKVVKL